MIQDYRTSYLFESGDIPLPDDIHAMPGKVVVSMAPTTETHRGLALPEELREDLRSDVGLVVSSGHEDFSRGDRVIVKPWHGKWVQGFGWDHATNHDIRFFGCWGGKPFNDPESGDPLVHPTLSDPTESIMAKINGDEIVPTGSNLYIRLRINDRKGSILLSTAEVDPVGEVIAAGPKCDVPVGANVVFHEGASQAVLRDDETESLFAIVPERFVYAIK